MFGVLGLGLLGMQHALEADHIAALSSIAARRTDVRDIVKHGLTWGVRSYADALRLLRSCKVMRSLHSSRVRWRRRSACWSASALTYCGGYGATACIFTGMDMAMAQSISMSIAM
jgi:hypothetical protein